jgi:L-rhamnose mutarotase
MTGVCFTNRVRPDRLEEYKQRHRAVWPDMLRALAETGWHDYRLFLTPDGLLIGFVECDDLDQSQAQMAAREVNQRWQAGMAEYFLPSDGRPDEGMVPVEQVFHLEEQLDRLDVSGGGSARGES